MFCMSYRFMARAALRKGPVKVGRPLKVSHVQTAAPGSILNGPVAPPLRMEVPKMPSLVMAHPTQAASDAMKRKASATKKMVKKPSKTTPKASGTLNSKDQKVTEKKTPKTGTRKPKKPLKRTGAGRPKALHASLKRSGPAKTNAAKGVKRR